MTKLEVKPEDYAAMLPTSTVQTEVGSATGALLELKLVGDITGRFFVARYQRGYRWGRLEVDRLLNDIWESNGAPYSLQPVVVKKLPEDKWELVDGQQRLTTLYLIFLYMQREHLQNAGPTYSIKYETRPDSETYLKDFDANTNIDFFHLNTAYDCIRTWFESHGHRRQNVANKFYGYLFDSVRVIWYEAPLELDSTTLFTRLNVGRIPLTDAELVKALLLWRMRGGEGRTDRTHEVASQWDTIERDLQDSDVWAFVAGAKVDCPTRISLLLDTLAGGPRGRERPLFHTFDTLRQEIESSSPEEVWNRVLDLHALVLGWYDDRKIYHKIGYLVAVGQHLGDLIPLARESTKSSFEAVLDERIRGALNLTPSGVTELNYENGTDREKCSHLLLLMNVETVRCMENSSERYPFRLHAAGAWSLEHIHAQHAQNLTKEDQWKDWLLLHRNALLDLHDLPTAEQERRDALVEGVKAELDQSPIKRDNFHNLAKEITDFFTHGDYSGQASIHSVHSISNLALLSSRDNSALGNTVFEVKRRKILELDRSGAYIPVCTRQVFLKYYTGADAQQIHFWGIQDRESYLNEMISPEHGVIFKYLKPEDPQP